MESQHPEHIHFLNHDSSDRGRELAFHPTSTLMSQIVEHTEIDEHLEKNTENLIVEHLFYTISIATNNRTPGIVFHCVNSQTRLTIRDTRVYNVKWMQVLYQYHAAAPPFVCVTLVRIGRSANVREFCLLVRNPSVASAISMVSHFWNICRVMSSPEVLRSRKHLGFAD